MLLIKQEKLELAGFEELLAKYFISWIFIACFVILSQAKDPDWILHFVQNDTNQLWP